MLDSSAVLVLGARKTEQSDIGAEWINRRMRELGGTPLRIAAEQDAGLPKIRIVIGTPTENGDVGKAVRSKEVNVGPANPGEQGYEICSSRDGRRIYLVGSDAIGTLYACVTFAELIRKEGNRLIWQEAKVRDWPDFRLMTLNVNMIGGTFTPELHGVFLKVLNGEKTQATKELFVTAFEEHFDRLLRWKVSCLHLYLNYAWGRRYSPETTAFVREVFDYGKKRGISILVSSVYPFAGFVRDHPDVKSELPPEPYPEYIRGWAPRLEPLRKKYAEDLALWLKDLGATDAGFHDTDTGGFDNPAQWNLRDEESRQRWGDDYAAATAHIHQAFYDAIRKEIPGIRFYFIVYPYPIGYMDTDRDLQGDLVDWGAGSLEKMKEIRSRYEPFWKRMAELVPQDVRFGVREETPGSFRRFRELTQPHGLFTWFGFNSPRGGWSPLVSSGPAWTGTFYGNPDDFLFTVPFSEGIVPIESLLVREYAWNTNTPGAMPFPKKPGRDGELFTTVLPHVVRNLFGREAAPLISRAVIQDMDPLRICGGGYDGVSVENTLDTHEAMEEQARRAGEGMKALDELWARCRKNGSRLGMDDFVFRRFVYLRELFHTCAWAARIQSANLLAREKATAQDESGARKALEQAYAWLEEARKDADTVRKERPADRVFDTPGRNRFADCWRVFMSEDTRLDSARARLDQTRSELSDLGPVPASVIETLRKFRAIRAVRCAAPVAVDGSLTEFSAAGAYPVETFSVLGGKDSVSRAPTRVRMLFDDVNIYIGMECWVPGEQSVNPQDTAEIFLRPADLSGDYIHFIVRASGTVRHQRCRLKDATNRQYDPDNAWVCESMETKVQIETGKWSVEMKIPRQSIGGKVLDSRWLANFCRDIPLPGGERELSSIQTATAADFHDLRTFRNILWNEEPYRPGIQLVTPGFKVSRQTLLDRITTVASFRLGISATQVLNRVSVVAEGYDGTGRKVATKEVLSKNRVYYDGTFPEVLPFEFPDLIERGGVRFVLACEEGTVSVWRPIGSWTGTPDIGSPFAGPSGNPLGTAYVREPVFFPSLVTVGDRTIPLMDAAKGTIEFWMRPEWRGIWPSGERCELRRLTRHILHFGVSRPDYPKLTNQSSLTLVHHDSYAQLIFSVTSTNLVQWAATVPLRTDALWKEGIWRHIALVWDAGSEPGDWLRVYVDGRRVSSPAQVSKTERLGEDKSVRVEVDSGYPVQAGCLNSGRFAADAGMDELRISRVPRYSKDFVPVRSEFSVDRDTSALFHFNNSLSGEGITSEGAVYSVEARPGSTGYF